MSEGFNSNIIPKKEDFSLVNEKLEADFNGEVEYNLIYRATRDGPTTDDFNKKCNGKNNQLVILKTKKGLIFGGFTGRGFQNSDEKRIIDDSSPNLGSTQTFSLYQSCGGNAGNLCIVR